MQLQSHYTISIDWKGKYYCGLELDWNYEDSHVTLSMPTYIINALQKFQHPHPRRPQNAQHVYAARDNNSDPLTATDTRLVQSICGTLLYNAQALCCTMLLALNEIASKQAFPTQDTMHACQRLLDYAATTPMPKLDTIRVTW
jgi:hypothetical protein